jgi:hypothetical protein
MGRTVIPYIAIDGRGSVAKEVKTTGLGEFGLSRLVETNFSPVGLNVMVDVRLGFR